MDAVTDPIDPEPAAEEALEKSEKPMIKPEEETGTEVGIDAAESMKPTEDKTKMETTE